MVKVREFTPGLGVAVAERSFARADESGAFESWGEVAKRLAQGNASLAPTGTKKKEESILYKAMASGAYLSSGRHLQHGDKDQKNRPQSVFANCSTSCTSGLLFELLLNGSGVGRSYDNDLMVVDWSKQPEVIHVIDPDHADVLSGEIADLPSPLEPRLGQEVVHVVDDSREGWGSAVKLIELMAFKKQSDKCIVFDWSNVRPRNSLIGGMQNRPASGPGPLIEALKQVATLRGKATMERWMQTMFVDHWLAECVVVGGARRSARLSSKYWKDLGIFDFITIKNEHGLWSSNNSIMVDAEFWKYVHRPLNDQSTVMHRLAVDVFEKATVNAYAMAEPGFINVDKLSWVSHTVGIDTGDPITDMVVKIYNNKKYQPTVNPCVTGDTWVDTSDGQRQVWDLLNEPFTALVNGIGYQSTAFWSNGFKYVYKVQLCSNHSLEATADHKILTIAEGQEVWVEVQDLNFRSEVVLWDGQLSRVKSVEEVGQEEVYDCTVDDVHRFSANGIIVHNCSEIVLSALGAFCIIGTFVPYFAANLDDALEAARAAVRMLIRVNTMGQQLYPEEVARTNRIGVGIAGVHEYAFSEFGLDWYDLIDESKSQAFWDRLKLFSEAVQDESETYSKELGLVAPHTVTCSKPDGSVAKLMGITEGIHLPAMAHYLRWVQFQSADPQVAEYKAKGYPTKELETYSGVTIVGFPTEPLICSIGMGDRLVTAAEATIDEQYTYLRLLEKYWLRNETGNQLSYTLKYDPSTVSLEDFQAAVKQNQHTVKCASMMPQADATAYEYQPEQPISKEEFDAIVGGIKTELAEDVGYEHMACEGGHCPIVFNEGEK